MKILNTLTFFLILFCSCHLSQAQDASTSKKLYHVLLFQWSDSLDVNVKTEVIDLFKGLPTKVEGFEEINIIDLKMSSDKFDIVIIQTFGSEEALERYDQHVDHIRITEIAPALLSGFSKFDYWK